MEPITLHEKDPQIEITPSSCSFFISFGVSLLRILVSTKNHTQIYNQTLERLISLFTEAREYGKQTNSLEKFGIFYQTLVLINDNDQQFGEQFLNEQLKSSTFLSSVDMLIRSILCFLFPEEFEKFLSRLPYRISSTHMQSLSESLYIHLSLALSNSFETYYCNRTTALLIFFYKIDEATYSIVKNFKNYQLFYTHRQEIPNTIQSTLNALSKIVLNEVVKANAVINLQKAAAENNEILSIDLRNFISKILPQWTGDIEEFDCMHCLQRKSEAKFVVCRNSCEVCAICSQENNCIRCGESYLI